METRFQDGAARGWSPLFMRFALGLVFLVSGAGKVFAVGPNPPTR